MSALHFVKEFVPAMVCEDSTKYGSKGTEQTSELTFKLYTKTASSAFEILLILVISSQTQSLSV